MTKQPTDRELLELAYEVMAEMSGLLAQCKAPPASASLREKHDRFLLEAFGIGTAPNFRGVPQDDIALTVLAEMNGETIQ